MPQQDEALRDNLISYLQDAYSMENHLMDVLERQIKDVQTYPSILAGVQRHLEETRQHRQRIEQCLQTYNKKPSGIKSLLSNLMGSVQGGLSGAR
jgi:ferritin-like metal-binding protein YciE